MSSGIPTDLPEVQAVLRRCRRQIYTHNTLAGIATLLIAACAYLLLAGMMDLALGLPGLVRAFTLTLFVLVVGTVAWRSLWTPLRSTTPAEQLGAAVDLSCPAMQESLSTLISIERPDATTSESGSELMRDQLKNQVSERLVGVTAENFVNTRQLQKRCGTAGLVILAGVAPFVFWPSASTLLLKRFSQPFANLATVSNLYFEIENANRTVARGSDVVLAAQPHWRSGTSETRPEVVTLELIAADGRTDRLTMNFDEVGSQFTAELPDIQESVGYRIHGDRMTSESFAITVVDAPELKMAVMTAVPPAYAGRAVKTFDGMIEEMNVFEKSELQILLEFSKPVRSASLVWVRRDARPLDATQKFDIEFDHMTGEEIIELDPDAPLFPNVEPLVMRSSVALANDGLSGHLDLTADVGGDFHFELIDEHELTNQYALERTLVVTWDRPPQLRVSGVRNRDRYRPDDILPVNCLASDDIGIGELELHYVANDETPTVLQATGFARGDEQVSEDFRLQLSKLGVGDGDTLRIRARAADERPVPGPHETWADEIVIEIDNNAPPPSARALEQETEQMIKALKAIASQIEKDKDTTNALEQDARDGWTTNDRIQAQRLSEKEQQQGQALDSIARTVATHPLMQDAAAALPRIAATLKTDLPEKFDLAVDQKRNLAAETLRKAGVQLEDVGEELQRQIDDIEKRAELERSLAELNRLALNAEQLAKDAGELEADRKASGDRANETNEDRNTELSDRSRKLDEDREELSDDIERLLDQQQELLKAAQQAQNDRLKQIQDEARKLAHQQERIAEGSAAEAKAAAQEAFRTSEKLEKLSDEIESLSQKSGDAEAVAPQAKKDVEEATRNLQSGNLLDSEKALKDASEELAKASQSNQQQADSADGNQKQTLQNTAERQAGIAEQLQQLKKDVQKIRDQRTPSATDKQSTDGNSDLSHSDVRDALNRLEQLTRASKRLADRLAEAPGETQTSRNEAREAAEQTQAATESASAGQFQPSAQQLRSADKSATQSAAAMDADRSESAAERESEMKNLSSELARAAETMEQLGRNSNLEADARQAAQNEVARRAGQLPERLSELTERMQLEALQMQQQARKAAEAGRAAQQAQTDAERAASELKNAQFQQASGSGESAAEQLQAIAGSRENQNDAEQNTPGMVPEQVGESVADALQNLKKAAESMKQQGGEQQAGENGENAEQGGGQSQEGMPGDGEQSAGTEGQPGDGQAGDGEGKPGQSGSPTAEQLESAAKSLAQAAENALPGQFNPNQSPDGQQSQQAGKDGTGNSVMWDGSLPGESPEDVNGSRDWGGVVDELNSETVDSTRVGRDGTYEALIRMYFRELARTGSRSAK